MTMDSNSDPVSLQIKVLKISMKNSSKCSMSEASLAQHVANAHENLAVADEAEVL